MEDMRSQFLDLLSDIGFVDKSKGPSVRSYIFYYYRKLSIPSPLLSLLVVV